MREKTKGPRGSYYDEDDIYDIKYESDNYSSYSDTSDFEEMKCMGIRDSMVDNRMREYQVQKGKVTSTYLMKADTEDLLSS